MKLCELFIVEYPEGLLRVANYLRSRRVPEPMVDDIAQGAWTRAWEKLHQFQGRSSLVTWVCTIAIRMYYRTTFTEQLLEFEPSEVLPFTLDQEIFTKQLIAGVSSHDQQILNFFYQGFNMKEIAEKLGSTSNIVRLRLWRARVRIRERFGITKAAA